MQRARNILFITSDELRGDCLGVAGNPEVRTPHLDALAARGALFEKHFAPFPKCVPSRCAMHTGRYTHTDGLRSVMKENHLLPGTPNLGCFLREQGFETAVMGLNHVWMDNWFYGKEGFESAMNYHSFTPGRLCEVLETKHPHPPGTPRTGSHLEALAQIDFDGLSTGESKFFCDENRTEQACVYLRELRNPDKPFFLQLNLGKPHPPYAIHKPYYSMYDPEKITPFPSDLPENAALPLRAQRKYRMGNDVPAAALREIQAVYYGMITFIDDLVGKVLHTLRELGLEEDTLVIFASDHGDYAGQHGINEKFDADLRDCLLHVAFIMAGPGIQAGTRFPGLSEHVDLPATLLDYLGLEKPVDWVWHGESLLPLLAAGKGKSAVFADGGHEKAMRDRFCTPAWEEKDGTKIKTTGGKQLTYQECPDAMARCKMVRTDDWKLIIRETGGNELYHLAEDPFEMRNLYGDPAHAAVVSDLQLRLIEWTLKTDTDRPFLRVFGA